MFDTRKYRPEDEALIDEFVRTQRHATLLATAVGEAPQASILPYVILDDGSIELHCVQADATFRAVAANPTVSLLVADYLADTPHHWIDPVDGSESTLHFQAVLIHGRAATSTDPGDVAAALARLMTAYGHGPDLRPIADDALYGPHLRRLGVVRITPTSRQAKFKVGSGSVEARIALADQLRERGRPGDARAADVVTQLAPRLASES